MRNKKSIFIILLTCCLAVLTAQSRHYKPMSDWEQSLYDAADRSIWPDDVRNSPGDYADTIVAWTGIVESYSVDESYDEFNVLWMHAKHHYYDWIEDLFYSTPILLSPSGEGYFTTYWLVNKSADLEQLQAGLDNSLIITYGYPVEVEDDDSIYVTGEYVRVVSPQYVNPNWLDYGRSGL